MPMDVLSIVTCHQMFHVFILSLCCCTLSVFHYSNPWGGREITGSVAGYLECLCGRVSWTGANASVCVCVCVCACVCMCVYKRERKGDNVEMTFLCVCVCVRAHTHMYFCVCACTKKRKDVRQCETGCLCVCVSVSLYICGFVCVREVDRKTIILCVAAYKWHV